MLSDTKKSILRKSPATLCVALSVALFFPPVLHSSGEPSYVEEIRRYVAEDKVYLLENIRQKVILPAEKLVIDALLSEDGPQAVTLYQKQLTQYPDPVLDQISTSRIAAYSLAKKSVMPLPRVTISEPSRKPNALGPIPEYVKQPVALRKEKSKQEMGIDTPTQPAQTKKAFALQCGSFKSRENAETLAKKISRQLAASVIPQGEFYKVILKTHYGSKEEAVAAAKKIPFETVVAQGL